MEARCTAQSVTRQRKLACTERSQGTSERGKLSFQQQERKACISIGSGTSQLQKHRTVYLRQGARQAGVKAPTFWPAKQATVKGHSFGGNLVNGEL